MKIKIVVLFFCVVLYALSVKAQIFKNFSVLTGPVFAQQKHLLTGPGYSINTKPLIGFTTNLRTSLYQSKNFYWQLDIGFIQKGSKTDFESLTANHLANDELIVNVGDIKKNRFNYLSFSSLFQFGMPLKKIEPYVLAAP
ncbi:MAG: hypothetical protein V1783_07745, partial [Bacteroidota bacterium]